MAGRLLEGALSQGGDAPGLRLIETFGPDSPRLHRHRTRMAAGAAALGWGFDAAGFDAAVAGAAAGQGDRLRLTLDRSGRFDLTQSALPPPPAQWRVALSTERLDSADPWLRLKSTHRAGYDRARAALPPGVDEVLLTNERGEVCDGAITTVFFDRGQGLRTPPLSSGLLPGVLRAEIAAQEEVLLARDLPRVRLWVGNSLRGLIEAVY